MAWGGCLRKKFQRLRKIRIEEQNGICPICGKMLTYEESSVDHIIPISKGGSKSDSKNIQAVHIECNKIKSGKLFPKSVRVLKWDYEIEDMFCEIDFSYFLLIGD